MGRSVEPGPQHDGLSGEERVALNQELEASIADADAGETVSFTEMISELRQQR